MNQYAFLIEQVSVDCNVDAVRCVVKKSRDRHGTLGESEYVFELFRRFDARRIFGFIRRLLGMSRPKVKCYDLLSNHALRVEGDSMREVVTLKEYYISIHALRVEGDSKNGQNFRLFLRKREKNLPL